MTRSTGYRPIAPDCGPLAALLAVAQFAGAAYAQRDPTVPPASALQPPALAVVRAAPQPPLAVIVREGQPYVVVGTRLVGQGQMLGTARIERIDETEIWLREGQVLHKLARYSGIQRKAAP